MSRLTILPTYSLFSRFICLKKVFKTFRELRVLQPSHSVTNADLFLVCIPLYYPRMAAQSQTISFLQSPRARHGLFGDYMSRKFDSYGLGHRSLSPGLFLSITIGFLFLYSQRVQRRTWEATYSASSVFTSSERIRSKLINMERTIFKSCDQYSHESANQTRQHTAEFVLGLIVHLAFQWLWWFRVSL